MGYYTECLGPFGNFNRILHALLPQDLNAIVLESGVVVGVVAIRCRCRWTAC